MDYLKKVRKDGLSYAIEIYKTGQNGQIKFCNTVREVILHNT